MKVIIDGTPYVPQVTSEPDTDILDMTFESRDLGRVVTVRYYLSRLAWVIWDQGEGLRGKKPFGNSGWQHELAGCLIDHGRIGGKRDAYKDLNDIDWEAANVLILAACDRLGGAA